MCGLAGIAGIKKEISVGLIEQMNASIQHRGPDASGLFIDNEIALGHRRLSIIDLSHGADQPFTDNSNRYVIVFNGEIYNYMEIKKELNYPWKTNSDTEVILAAFIQWGKNCVHKLNGMFAFAIWDKEEKELFIVRDRLGVKPLYYYHSGDLFVFASELRCVLSSGLIERKIDPVSLVDYMGNMTVRTPATIIQNVYQLCPGQYAVLKAGNLEKTFYWNMVNDKKPKEVRQHSEVVKTIRTLFENSVKSRMVADVKVGAFLSGGIDSSAVVAQMSKNMDKPVETFSIVFNDEEFDESEYSRMIANKYKTKHTEFLLEPKELITNLPDYIRSMDTPTVDGINTYMVSKLVANTGIKVVLTGIGGDELFAGYSSFMRWKSFRKFGFLFKLPFAGLIFNLISSVKKSRKFLKISDMFRRKSSALDQFYANSRSIFLEDEIKKLIKIPEIKNTNWVDLNSKTLESYPDYSKYSVAELTNYTLDVLMKDTDQMSMAWALEVREPFFDYQLIEYVLQIEDHEKVKKGIPKSLLVEAMGDMLPKEIVFRPKKGFTFPWNSWLRNDLKTFCEDSIASLSKRGILNEKGLSDLWDSFIQGKNAVTWMHIWSLVILEQWMEANKINS